MNGFNVDCSMQLSYFHVIDQSENALELSQSEVVFLTSWHLLLYISTTDLYQKAPVATDWSVLSTMSTCGH